MAANVESMFYVREAPWHGLGTKVKEAPTSNDALILAGLNWQVLQEPIFTATNEPIEGYKVNIRDSDIVKPLGWYRDGSRLTDVDIQYLVLYLEEHYGLTSESPEQ
ncbi:hypothetical protein [Schaedlerella arabinosiphila]|uniref:hypothetical protein n=1 Tax=Schaedlerella arabinosiphila TaxID=2044587 RepID=UPI002ED3DBF6